MLVILVRVYDEDTYRISTRFLAMPVCNIGIAENILNALNKVFIDRNISWKNCIGYASDNANVMVGWNNSLLSRVREKNPDIMDIGCVCHLANITAQKAIKTLPLPVEDLLIDVHFHCFHSSKRKQEYKEFLTFTDTEPMKLIKHCAVPGKVKRLLQQWSALKNYFCSHEEGEKPGRVQRCRDYLSSGYIKLS